MIDEETKVIAGQVRGAVADLNRLLTAAADKGVKVEIAVATVQRINGIDRLILNAQTWVRS